MSTPEFYRAEAARCRRLAEQGADRAARRRWQQLADEYDQLAVAMEPPPVVRMPMQQQPMQQQQKKSEDEK
jgi:hypothetical protein